MRAIGWDTPTTGQKTTKFLARLMFRIFRQVFTISNRRTIRQAANCWLVLKLVLPALPARNTLPCIGQPGFR